MRAAENTQVQPEVKAQSNPKANLEQNDFILNHSAQPPLRRLPRPRMWPPGEGKEKSWTMMFQPEDIMV